MSLFKTLKPYNPISIDYLISDLSCRLNVEILKSLTHLDYLWLENCYDLNQPTYEEKKSFQTRLYKTKIYF